MRSIGVLAFVTMTVVAWWSPRPVDAQADLVGQWGPPFSFQSVAVHLHVLPTGKVMYYSRIDDPRIYDPADGSLTLIPQAGYNIFCTGHSFMADGRLHVTGGHIENGWGLPNLSIYDPFANSWTRLADMNNGRWYPTNVTLANGEVLVISGSYDTDNTINPLPQVWTGSAWRDLTAAQMVLPFYPDLHLAPNGRVFQAGPGQATRYLDTSGAGAWTAVANRLFSNRDYGSSVLYDDGKVIHIGGGDPSTATAEVIDLNASPPSWRYTANSMSINRRQINATLLPDGKVLVTGGVSGPGFNDTSTPVYSAEMWDPATDRFTTMAAMAVGRWYHSTAALLPDGRVISAGGDGNPSAEIYSPPYLFQGARPVIASAPSSVGYGGTFFVGTPDAASIASVHWVRLSSVTHANNMDQRMNRLTFTQAPGGLEVTAPSSSFLCPPGPYLLFLLYSNGVPSTGSTIRISTAGGSAPAAPTGLSAAAASAIQVNLAWEDNAADEDGYRIERSTDGLSFSQVATAPINARSWEDTGLAASTTYHYRVRAYNASGDSGYSNVASATTPAGLPPAAPGSLSATTSSSSTINLAWSDRSGDESGFRIERSTDGLSFSQVATAPVNATSFQNTGLAASTTYHYRVRAYNASGDSAPSNTANATTLPLPPAAPGGLSAVAVSTSQINLTWTDSSTNEQGFKVYRSTDGNTFTRIATLGPNTTAYASTGLDAGRRYYYRVRAYNAGGDSAYTAIVSATTLTAAPAITLVASKVIWKYRDNGSNQGTAWRALGFSDLFWPSGAAQLGYGDGDEATVVKYGLNPASKHVTTYFRRKFSVTSAASFKSLTLGLLRDDGGVVYLNGVEVFRSNMPAGTITYTTLASSSGTSETAFFETGVSPFLLVNGTNVLAVEIHQASRDSSDLSFDLRLTGTQ